MKFPSQGDMTLFVIAMFTITRLINFVESRRQRRLKLHMQDATGTQTE